MTVTSGTSRGRSPRDCSGDLVPGRRTGSNSTGGDRSEVPGRRPETERAIAVLSALHRLYLRGELSGQALWKMLFGPLAHRLAHGPRFVDDFHARLEGWDGPPADVVLTTYFASRPDPQTGICVPADELGYIAPWYWSLRATRSHGVIFHDHLSQGFVSRHETDRIRFVRIQLGRYNLNDERFLLYLGYLLDHPSSVVFMTDATDVVVSRSPRELVSGTTAARIYVGRDRFNLLGQSGWMAHMARSIESLTGWVPSPDLAESPMYNAGVVGGGLYPVLFLLVEMVRRFLLLDSPEEHDMFVLNQVIHRHFRAADRLGLFLHPFRALEVFQPEHELAGLPDHLGSTVLPGLDSYASSFHVASGYPVCSAFGHFEDDSDAVFIHK